MGIRSSIRNFFYAATHANELIEKNRWMQQELEDHSVIISNQRDNIIYLSEVNERWDERWQSEMQALQKQAELQQLHIPGGPGIALPVGRIDYLSHSGKVVESIEHTDAQNFVSEVKQANDCGQPMSITVYAYSGEPLDDTSWRLELDPPPQGFQVVPYDKAESLKQFSPKELAEEINLRSFPRVAIESTLDYSDPTFYPKIDGYNRAERYRVVTFSSEWNCCITPMTRALDSYEAAVDAISGNPTLRMVDYTRLTEEVARRREPQSATRDLSRYPTAQLQERLAQLNQEAAMEPPTPTPEPTPEFELE
ncbi:MAG: hypothetical protein IJX67_05365 [Oscillospiraceae bacterium]|nr:hypothetical protein [Oscillospiraceae bacterium]